MSELPDLFSHLGDSISQLYDLVSNLFSTLGDRVTTNVGSSFAQMSPEKWIRLVIIVGTYALLRPYLIKLGAKSQMKSHEKEAEEAEAQAQAQISPNQLRGKVDIPEDSDDEEEQPAGASTGTADWGKKARKRQRGMLKKLIDAEEKRLQELHEDEEDKDIEEYLVG